MARELPKAYEPNGVEKRIYAMWKDSGAFTAHRDPDKKPFTIVIPPPNVTGQLHMGHALDETWQDILIRYKRMQGYSALWVPGTDHAGIATQVKVEENLRKTEGKSRYDVGREKFLEMVWDWKRRYEGRIHEQIAALGASVDWTRMRFTMDEGLSRAVREVFNRLYEKGLIYQGNRIINWCPHCRTALSDAEVEYAEQEGAFWHIRYPVKDSDEFVIIATTRPETLLGDSAVAVHPDDERYTHLVGKKLILPLVGREIPVVADEYVEKDFGTGCVKITPCHDPNDFEVGKRHDLEEILIMDGDAKIINGGKYNGMDRYEARKAIVADLEAGGYLVKIEPYKHNVGQCERCGCTVEPLASKQWFVKVGPMVGPAIDAVKDGTIKFVPDRFSKNYLNWMEGLHDWCISRQLWWGHRIPAFYCDDCGETTVSREDITTCPKCGGHVHQDEDVLDTWFSSALWPFSTLGWPDETEDLKYFYPTDVLVTGYDIITFWVSRMIFSGLEHTGKAPFHTVALHGLVRDAQGRKMSKSLGNGIDPLEIIENFGCDALRASLVIGNEPGMDMRFTDEKVSNMRNFANKLWNASRFVMMNLRSNDRTLPENLRPEDKWILSKYNALVRDETRNLDKFEFGLAMQKIYDFVWGDFCDWYIELTKPRLQSDDAADHASAERVLLYVLSGALKLLHPFMPFVTEEIWQSLELGEGMLMSAEWPEYSPALDFSEVETEVEAVMELIRAVRTRRADMNVPPSRKAHLLIVSENLDTFKQMDALTQRLAFASSIEYATAAPADLGGMTTAATPSAQVYMPTGDLVDLAKERERLEKELVKAQKDLEVIERKLSNEGFVSKAPEAVVASERERAEGIKTLISRLEESLKSFN